jgi:modified peptide precursor CbpA
VWLAGALFVFCLPEEWKMSKIISETAANTVQTQPASEPQTPLVAPTIATRKSCNPDGIGLSHYVLMDRKAAK